MLFHATVNSVSHRSSKVVRMDYCSKSEDQFHRGHQKLIRGPLLYDQYVETADLSVHFCRSGFSNLSQDLRLSVVLIVTDHALLDFGVGEDDAPECTPR